MVKNAATKKNSKRSKIVDLDEEASFITNSPYVSPTLEEASITKKAISTKPQTEKPHYFGHRERLRSRFLQSNGAALVDYELLELILHRSIIRADSKPLAKKLITHFGSLFEVFGADYKSLLEIKGCGPSIALDIKIIHKLFEKMSLAPLCRVPTVFPSWEALVNHCRIKLANEKREHFYLLFLNKKNGLLNEELQQIGTVDHTPVYPREVLRRALEIGASSIILVHNHPSGDPEPSPADIDVTLKLQTAAETLNIKVQDHLIIGKNSYCSLKKAGFIL